MMDILEESIAREVQYLSREKCGNISLKSLIQKKKDQLKNEKCENAGRAAKATHGTQVPSKQVVP